MPPDGPLDTVYSNRQMAPLTNFLRRLPLSPERLLCPCAVTRRRFPVGASPTRRPLQPEAIGAVMEVTKWLKPSISVSRNTVTARVCRP